MKKEGEKRTEYLSQKAKRLFGIFYVLLIILILVEFFIHKHIYFPWEKWFGFYAVFGFISFVVLIITAKYILRPIVKREEDYYD